MMTEAKTTATITVENHPNSSKHVLLKAVTRKGYVYACSFAWEPEDGPKPTVETATDIWLNDRKAFSPFNESTGRFA